MIHVSGVVIARHALGREAAGLEGRERVIPHAAPLCIAQLGRLHVRLHLGHWWSLPSPLTPPSTHRMDTPGNGLGVSILPRAWRYNLPTTSVARVTSAVISPITATTTAAGTLGRGPRLVWRAGLVTRTKCLPVPFEVGSTVVPFGYRGI
jgi:hypothetical protein